MGWFNTAQCSLQVPIPEGNSLVQNSTYHVNGSYTGLLTQTLHDNLYPDYGEDYTSNGSPVFFSTVFGVLFSGVTGIMAGANMSGNSYLSLRIVIKYYNNKVRES